MQIRLFPILLFVLAGLSACGGGSSDSPAPPDQNPPAEPPLFEDMEVVRYPMGVTTPAKSDSPYADVLQDCTFSNTRSTPCTLGTLPLVGGVTPDPTVDDIMDRVLVSHEWMGGRFRELLVALPDDMRLMLRAVTAVVISSDVRPSFYWTATGAIYLDPESLWLTPGERAVIPTTPDFRSEFGNDLQFAMPWRYVKDNQYASVRFGPGSTRTVDDIVIDFARLLYHELAHANDFFPPAQQSGLPTDVEIWRTVADPTISDSLASLMPLQSDEMYGLAAVSFHGETATSAQKAYTPEQVAGFFSPDAANAYYNYSSEREDLAMLFEVLMMRARFGVEMDTAVTNNPQGEDVTGDDYIVAWGQRNRLGDPAVRERARYAVSRLLPEVSLDAYIDALPLPLQMRAGESWTDNLVLDPTAPVAPADKRGLAEQPVQLLPGYH